MDLEDQAIKDCNDCSSFFRVILTEGTQFEPVGFFRAFDERPLTLKRNLKARRHAGGTSRLVRHIRPLQSNLDCTGTWCGRQFVLIVGIGF